MTGQYAHTNGLISLVDEKKGWQLPLSTKTIVDHLNEAGFETAHCGHQHERIKAKDNRYQIENGQGGPETFAENAAADGIRYLESRRGATKPFYLNVGIKEVHGSMWQTKAKLERYKNYGCDPDEHVYMPPHLPNFPALRREQANFQGCIRYLDSHVGRLLNAVERLGYFDDSLVLFTTDHGIMGHRAKNTLYDAGTEVALLVRIPGGASPGVKTNVLIPNIDLVPTMLAAVGVPIPTAVQGRSFLPVLAGKKYEPHEQIFLEKNYHGDGYDPIRAVRTPRYLYLRNFDPEARRRWLPAEVKELIADYVQWWDQLYPDLTEKRPEEELYDVTQDPNQFVNLAGRPESASRLEEFRSRLNGWMKATDDPLLRKK